jgi:hypothetical protein
VSHEGPAHNKHLLLTSGQVATCSITIGLQYGKAIVNHVQIS